MDVVVGYADSTTLHQCQSSSYLIPFSSSPCSKSPLIDRLLRCVIPIRYPPPSRMPRPQCRHHYHPPSQLQLDLGLHSSCCSSGDPRILTILCIVVLLLLPPWVRGTFLRCRAEAAEFQVLAVGDSRTFLCVGYVRGAAAELVLLVGSSSSSDDINLLACFQHSFGGLNGRAARDGVIVCRHRRRRRWGESGGQKIFIITAWSSQLFTRGRWCSVAWNLKFDWN